MFKQYAFSLVEVLVSLAILSFALLSLIKFQTVSLSYLHEALLLAKASNIINDVALAGLYDDGVTESYHDVRMQFPSAQLKHTVSDNQIAIQLTWKLPRLPTYELKFNVES